MGDVNQTSRDNENRYLEEEWAASYKIIIEDIANSGTYNEAQQKESMYEKQLAAFKDSGINVNNDLAYIYNNLEKTKLKGISLGIPEYAPVPAEAVKDAALAVDNTKPNVVAGKIPGIERGLDDKLYNFSKNIPTFQEAVKMFVPQSFDSASAFNWSNNFIGKVLPEVEVIIGGYNKVDRSAVSVAWDSAMGYMHGLAGAQGAYYNRSDDYKFSWNLANNAMRKLADATGKVAETAPPVLPGRGPNLGLELATGGVVARPPSVTAPSFPIYFSSTESNEASASKSKTSVPNANNYRESYLKENPGMPTEFQVHHTLPQKYQETLNGKGINIHETKYLEGIDPDTHRLITKEWQRWEKSLGRTPTAEEIINFAKQIDSKYGEFWYNK